MQEQKFMDESGKIVITGDMLISDVITAYPKAGAVLTRYGLHCVGCAASQFDTIEDGAKLHGMPQDDIDQMIADVNAALNKKIDTIEFTKNAVAKVKEFRAKEEKEGLPLRIAVIPGGCSGFSYDMDFKEKQENDREFEFDGVVVVVDPDSYDLLKGSSIDYIDSMMGAGFKIDNPNANRKCGCGKSFG